MFGMRKSGFIGLFMTLCLYSMSAFAQMTTAATLSPVGTWLTIDDETNKPRSVIQIWDQDGQLEGKVVKVFYRQGEGPKDVCDKCTDPEHQNKRILGMTILWGMQQDNALQWGGGNILDPHNGKIYRCQMQLSPNNQQLAVRGYIGISLLGRSQTWLRVS
jgi:uncharacterized protein (DUF2147 family)